MPYEWVLGIAILLILIGLVLLKAQGNKYKRAIRLIVALLSEHELILLKELDETITLRENLIKGPIRDYERAKSEIVRDIDKAKKQLEKEFKVSIKKLDPKGNKDDKKYLKELQARNNRNINELDYEEAELLDKLYNRYKPDIEFIKKTKNYDKDAKFVVKALKEAKKRGYEVPEYKVKW